MTVFQRQQWVKSKSHGKPVWQEGDLKVYLTPTGDLVDGRGFLLTLEEEHNIRRLIALRVERDAQGW